MEGGAKRLAVALAATVWVAMMAVAVPIRPDHREPAVNGLPPLVDLASPIAPASIAFALEPMDVPQPDEVLEPEPTATQEPLPELSEPCADTLAWVTTAGLSLPSGVGYHCPSTQFAHHGAACWNSSVFCPRSGFISVNLDLIGGRSTAYLRHVVAHEICHIMDFQATGRTTEAGADDCATRHLALLERT